jgi:hypothetical protein
MKVMAITWRGWLSRDDTSLERAFEPAEMKLMAALLEAEPDLEARRST